MVNDSLSKFLETLGLEINEEFNVYLDDEALEGSPYVIMEDGCYDKDSNMNNHIIYMLLFEDHVIEKTPWVLKKEEKYCYLDTSHMDYPNTYYVLYRYYHGGVIDMFNKATGNYFKTGEEALEAKDELLEKFEKIKKGELRI